jgi:hypothetical protein
MAAHEREELLVGNWRAIQVEAWDVHLCLGGRRRYDGCEVRRPDGGTLARQGADRNSQQDSQSEGSRQL